MHASAICKSPLGAFFAQKPIRFVDRPRFAGRGVFSKRVYRTVDFTLNKASNSECALLQVPNRRVIPEEKHSFHRPNAIHRARRSMTVFITPLILR